MEAGASGGFASQCTCLENVLCAWQCSSAVIAVNKREKAPALWSTQLVSGGDRQARDEHAVSKLPGAIKIVETADGRSVAAGRGSGDQWMEALESS